MTGVPVFHCRSCGGALAPCRSAAGIFSRFRFFREHAEVCARLGETLADEMKRTMEREHGPSIRFSGIPIPLPVVVPLADAGPEVRLFPVVTYLLIGVSIGVYLFPRIGEGAPALPGGLQGTKRANP